MLYKSAVFVALLFLIIPIAVFAQTAGQPSTAPATNTVTINAQSLIPKASVFFSPATQSVIEGSTFDVSVYLNTQQSSVNTLDLTVQFPPDKLSIVSPSGGKSLIQVWLQPPSYSNVNGTAEFTGIIPNGAVTQSGLITTITFKAIAPGDAPITISPGSSLLANDGLGTQMNAEFGRADYTVTPQPPAGVTVFSQTHPFSSQWYNNNDPVLAWQKDPNVTDFSYVLDNEPNTIPDDIVDTTGTSMAYQNLGDGLWYFHIKARKLGVWGATTNFLIQIDTQPPATFTPTAAIVAGSSENKILVSYFTTDDLSGIDHYEVATIDNKAPAVASPVFVQSESPYQLSTPGAGSYHVIVRAFDHAGNVRDASIDVTISAPFIQFLKNNALEITIGLLLIILLLFILHYFFGHKLLRRVHRAIVAAEQEDRAEKLDEAKQLIEEEKKTEHSEPGSPQPPLPPQQ